MRYSNILSSWSSIFTEQFWSISAILYVYTSTWPGFRPSHLELRKTMQQMERGIFPEILWTKTVCCDIGIIFLSLGCQIGKRQKQILKKKTDILVANVLQCNVTIWKWRKCLRNAIIFITWKSQKYMRKERSKVLVLIDFYRY